MKRTQKILTLVVVLMAPILVFLFLKQFGDNKFELPVYYQDGSPLSQCHDSTEQHKVHSLFIDNSIISLPAIFVVAGEGDNEYKYDLENVLAKYPEIEVWKIHSGEKSSDTEKATSLNFNEESFLDFINCELVLGEDHWLKAGIPYKYVLVDREARIRGYIECTTLKEIERLDTELDILLNY